MRGLKLLPLMLVVLSLASCKDEPAEIAGDLFGGNLINTNIYITSGDTVAAQNINAGAIDFRNSFTYLMLGEYQDTIYGDIKASFASEFSLSKTEKYSINSVFK